MGGRGDEGREAVARLADEAFACVSTDEVVALALQLAGIDSPAGQEGELAEFLYTWLGERGYGPRRVGLPARPNLMATLGDEPAGLRLILNSHMDTSVAADEVLSTLHAADAIYHRAWREGDLLVGHGVANNKGGMVATLLACEALRRSGVRLPGQVVLSFSAGEIEVEPVDEFEAPRYLGNDLGARYLVAHGCVGDYALVAEGTGFGIGWAQAGRIFFKVTVVGAEPPRYTPFVEPEPDPARHPSALMRALPVLQALHRWAQAYPERHRAVTEGGEVLPRVSVGAIRAGLPYKVTKAPGTCWIYVDARMTPQQSPMEVYRELDGVLKAVGVPYRLEVFNYRRGFVGRGVEPLVQAVGEAHRRVFGEPLKPCEPVYTSMWRDINPFNEAGIPAVMYGPGASVGTSARVGMAVQDLVLAVRVYVHILLEMFLGRGDGR